MEIAFKGGSEPAREWAGKTDTELADKTQSP